MNTLKEKIAFIPVGAVKNLDKNFPYIKSVKLDKPELPQGIKIVVVDFLSTELNETWKSFLSDCMLNGVKVYNAKDFIADLTGRIKTVHFYETEIMHLQPKIGYSFWKRLIESILILLSMPLVLPIMVITAIAIRLESKGSVFFIQNRVGKGGKEFSVYKFRSMCSCSEKDGAQFAAENDVRVTKVGQFIRKTRIDELPQFFNVLKGDMSLIGPRPEQKVFVDQFIQEIPFYQYRHLVKPGISGWAQVMQGYTADVDSTKVKLEYDLYYIKNYSFKLDVLIIFKTIETMITGFGAR